MNHFDQRQVYQSPQVTKLRSPGLWTLCLFSAFILSVLKMADTIDIAWPWIFVVAMGPVVIWLAIVMAIVAVAASVGLVVKILKL